MTTYAELNRRMTGRCLNQRKVANNTYAQRRAPGRIAIRLHRTDIVTFRADGCIELNSGGWRTTTTKDRINLMVSDCRLTQRRGDWFVTWGGVEYPFTDGMILRPNGNISAARQRLPIARSPVREDQNAWTIIQERERRTWRVDETWEQFCDRIMTGV